MKYCLLQYPPEECYFLAVCHIVTFIPQGMNICQTRRAYATTFNPSSPLVTRLHPKNTLTASEHGFSILTLVAMGTPAKNTFP